MQLKKNQTSHFFIIINISYYFSVSEVNFIVKLIDGSNVRTSLREKALISGVYFICI